MPGQLLYRAQASDWSSPQQSRLCTGNSSTRRRQVTGHHHSRAGYARATPLPDAGKCMVITTAEQAMPGQLLYRAQASAWSSPLQTRLCLGNSSTGSGQVTGHHHSRAGYARATPLPGADKCLVITTAEQSMPAQLLYRAQASAWSSPPQSRLCPGNSSTGRRQVTGHHHRRACYARATPLPGAGKCLVMTTAEQAMPRQLLYQAQASAWSSPPQSRLCPGNSSTGRRQVTGHHHRRAGYARATPLPGAGKCLVITTAEQAMPGQLLYRAQASDWSSPPKSRLRPGNSTTGRWQVTGHHHRRAGYDRATPLWGSGK